MCKAVQTSSPETQNLKQRFLNKSRHYPSTAPTQFSVVWNYWLVSLLTFSLDFVVIQLERNKMKKNIICTAFQNCSIYFTNSKHLKMHLQKNSVINTFPNADRKHSSAHSAQTANASFCAHMAWTEDGTTAASLLQKRVELSTRAALTRNTANRHSKYLVAQPSKLP